MPLTWTTEPPTVSGWYWIRGKNLDGSMAEPKVVHSTNPANAWVVWCDFYRDCEIAGPIPEPIDN